MKRLEPFEYVPDHQPDEANPVSFRLRPLDMPGYHDIQASMNDQGVPTSDGVRAASRYIVGWKGEALGDFSRAKVNQIVNGGFDFDWWIWLTQITGRLYSASLLKEDEEKKS